MADYQEASYLDQRTPVQCRNGPLQQRSCTDCCCCIIYIVLIAAVVFLGIFSAQAKTLERGDLEKQLDQAQFGKPLIAINEALVPIILSLAFVTALSFILVLTTFLIPSIVTYIYIPLFLILMLLVAVVFFLRYFGQTIPLISQEKQNKWAQSKSEWTLAIGIIFIVGFIAAIVTIISKRGKFKNIVPVLQMAKLCFWENCHLIFASFFFSILSIGALTVNIILLAVSQTRQSGQDLIDPRILGGIIIIEALWTHGFLEALSDFFFESIAVHWYFNKRRQLEGQGSGCCSTLCETNKLVIRHIGTIVYGHILAYIPETLNTMLGRCQNNCGCCYTIFCCFHKYTFNHLTKYCYIQTILQSYPFCPANTEMFGLRKRTKATLPELYMMGNFYITLAKIFIIMTALALTYVLIAQEKEDLMKNVQNIIAPLIVTLFASLQIAGHFMNTTGLIGDTITFMYTADLEIEKKHYGEMVPYSCPQEVEEIIHNIKVGQILDDDN